MIIESSPTNLDPRVGIDAQSERIDALIFDDLLDRDEHLNVTPALAERWEIPDPLTYIFHLRHGVKFHDGRSLTSRDVKWTFDSMLQSKIRTTRAAAYRYVDHVEAPDDYTVVFRMKEPYSTLLWNLSDGAMGIVPYGSLTEMTAHPVGSGPFRFVRAEQDNEVIIERNDAYWGDKPRVPRVRFVVVPDTTTRALELRKGSADIASNALTSDTVLALEKEPNLQVERAPGTVYSYLAFNLRDPILRDVRVRHALAYAIDRRPMIHYMWRDFAKPADSILPPQSWAYDADVPKYAFDPEKARQILDAAGYRPVNGIRFHITMKTSTEETTRLMVAVLQQQLRDVGIALDIRTFESATFMADVISGAYQMYSLRWIGGNEDPDIFEYAFHSDKFPPHGANRSFLCEPKARCANQPGPPRNRSQPPQGGVRRYPDHPGHRPPVHQPLVSRQRDRAYQASAQHHAESVGELRLPEDGGVAVASRRLSVSSSSLPTSRSSLRDTIKVCQRLQKASGARATDY